MIAASTSVIFTCEVPGCGATQVRRHEGIPSSEVTQEYPAGWHIMPPGGPSGRELHCPNHRYRWDGYFVVDAPPEST